MIETLLKIHEDSDDVDFKNLWREGVFVFDSNVLLDLYRLPELATKDLINVLKNKDFNNRIWIGFQGLLEFLNNRHEAISDQKNKFNTVKKLINDSIVQFDEVFDSLIEELSKLKLKQRHSLIDPDKFLTQDNINNGKRFLELFVDDLSKLESKQSDVNDEDKIKEIVLEIFKGKIGEGFTNDELKEIYKEGEKRYESETPPGYKDKAKKGFYKVEDRDFIRKYGDLILWKEIIRKASLEKISYIVLVTGDVKEDWWVEKRGKKLGPRKELLNEIYTNAPEVKTFYLYDTSNFLKHAKSELQLNISDSSINQAKDLIERSRKNRFIAEEGSLSIPDVINSCSRRIAGFRVGIGRSVHDLPPVKMNKGYFYSSLIEIFMNANMHGINNYVGVQAKKLGNYIVLRFKNRISADNLTNNMIRDTTYIQGIEVNSRGHGVTGIRDMMLIDGIDVHVVQNQKNFILELYIPISSFYFDANAELSV